MAIASRIVPVLLGLFMVGATTGATTGAAQETSVSVADAQAFLGSWAVALDAQGQTFVMDLNITDADGNVAAEVSNEMMPAATKAQRISKNGENLVIAFSMEAEGQQFPVVMTLTPEADALNASVDFAGGAFVSTGKGTKK
jgi:hypothetical protein